MNIILYSTGCPKCSVLSRKLTDKNIKYEVCNDIEKMQDLDIMAVPVLSVDGELFDFTSAINWINNYEGE